MAINVNENLLRKREEVLEAIKPIMEAFSIKDYEYIVKNELQTETLRIGNDYIGCSCNSLYAVKNEVIGWLFARIFCKSRSIGRFETQTLNQVKAYWLTNESKIANGFIKEDI